MSRKKFCVNAICGNESRYIKQWSESVMKTNPDYVVVNLTQYDDDSEGLLRQHIPKEKLILVKNPWKSSFSEARNNAFKNIPKGLEFTFFLDLDEVLTEDTYPLLEEFLNREDAPCLVLFDIMNTVAQPGLTASLFYPRGWFLKDKKGDEVSFRMEGTVHNQLVIDPKHNFQSVRYPFTIMHYGYSETPEIMERKHKRSEALLRKQIEEDSNSFFPRLNLAQLLRAKGAHEETLVHALKVLEIVKDRRERGEKAALDAALMAMDQVCTSLIYLKRYDEAIEYAEEALKIKPDYLDALVDISNAYLEKRDLEKAKYWMKKYLLVHSRYDAAKDNTNLILNHLNSTFLMLYHLGVVEAMQGDIKSATEYFKKAYDQQPLFRDTFVKYLNGLKIMGQMDLFNQEINKAMNEQSELRYQIYEFLSDLELEMGNIERAKFNIYQAVHIAEDAPEYSRIKNKHEGLFHVFGDVSNKFFETNKTNSELKKKITT